MSSGQGRERSRGGGTHGGSRNINFVHTERILAVKEEPVEEKGQGGKIDQSKERQSHVTLQATPTTGASQERPVVAANQSSSENAIADSSKDAEEEESNKVRKGFLESDHS